MGFGKWKRKRQLQADDNPEFQSSSWAIFCESPASEMQADIFRGSFPEYHKISSSSNRALEIYSLWSCRLRPSAMTYFLDIYFPGAPKGCGNFIKCLHTSYTVSNCVHVVMMTHCSDEGGGSGGHGHGDNSDDAGGDGVMSDVVVVMMVIMAELEVMVSLTEVDIVVVVVVVLVVVIEMMVVVMRKVVVIVILVEVKMVVI